MPSSGSLRVLVVGGGIVGLATARALLAAGHRPVVLDQGPIPSPLAASFDRHRAIRVTYGGERGYARMALEAFAAWERLFADLGSRHLVDTGQVVLGPPEDPWIAGSLADLEALGLPFERLGPAELVRRFPHLRPEPGEEGAFFVPRAGALLADRILLGLARFLRERGVPLLEGRRVVGLDPERARVRLADGGSEQGDALLVAAGAWLPRLVPGLAARLLPSRQCVLYVRPPAALEPAWRDGPLLTHKDARRGILFYALPAVGGAPAKLGDHRFTAEGDPDEERTAQEVEIAAIRALARGTLAEADSYRLLEPRICYYTVSPDERFVAVAEGRMLAVSACSGHGFKFGALLGERIAAALSGELSSESLAAWLAGAGG